MFNPDIIELLNRSVSNKYGIKLTAEEVEGVFASYVSKMSEKANSSEGCDNLSDDVFAQLIVSQPELLEMCCTFIYKEFIDDDET